MGFDEFRMILLTGSGIGTLLGRGCVMLNGLVSVNREIIKRSAAWCFGRLGCVKSRACPPIPDHSFGDSHWDPRLPENNQESGTWFI